VVEDAVAPDPVGRDPARGACRKVEPVRPGWTEQRTKVVRAQRRVVEQAVVERQLGRRVVADRRVAVTDPVLRSLPEPVHLPRVVLLVHRSPRVRRIGCCQARELEWVVLAAARVGLEVLRRRPVTLRLHLRRVAVVMIERPVLLAGDHQVLERRLHPRHPARTGGSGSRRPQRAPRHRDSSRARPLQERAAREPGLVRPVAGLHRHRNPPSRSSLQLETYERNRR
jgi:hypothetical protein